MPRIICGGRSKCQNCENSKFIKRTNLHFKLCKLVHSLSKYNKSIKMQFNGREYIITFVILYQEQSI